jgi:alpha-amylase
MTVQAILDPYFIPLGYALILLRANSGYPCVFYGDLYGMKGPRATPPSCGGKLAQIVLARTLYAYGHQTDYFDQAHCIGTPRLLSLSHQPTSSLPLN